MSRVSPVFDSSRREDIFRTVPQPQEQEPLESPTPWQRIQGNQMPPMMLQLRLANGEAMAYSYSDIRQIRVRDAGFIQLFVAGFTRVVITLEGRLLQDLAQGIGSGMIQWVQEADDRDVDCPESDPAIVGISIDPYSED